MQEQDTTKKDYWDNKERVAELINVGLLKGEPWVKPEDIEEVDSSSYGTIKWFGQYEPNRSTGILSAESGWECGLPLSVSRIRNWCILPCRSEPWGMTSWVMTDR